MTKETSNAPIYCSIVFAAFITLLYLNIEHALNLPVPFDIKPKVKITESFISKDLDNKQDKSEIVLLNTNTLKYHKTTCRYAKKCKHCIKIHEAKAFEYSAAPCKVCHH